MQAEGLGAFAERETRPGGITEFHESSIDEATGAAAVSAAAVLAPPPLPPMEQTQHTPRLESVDVGLAKLQEIRECVDNIATDGAKFFDKGNKAAGVRARKALQDLKTLAQELRVAIQRCKSESAHARLLEQQNGEM